MAEPGRYALVVSNSRYADPSLRPLTAPTEDAKALARVLRDPTVGAFDDVREIVDQPSYTVAKEVQLFFKERRLNDIALFYFSGHGIKDEDGRLYFAAMDTDPELLWSTAVRSSDMVAVMSECRSRQQVLLLDCCYAGAISRAMLTKSDKRVGVQERFATEGAGRVVITASDSMQVALEGGRIRGKPTPSVFTHVLVEGIESGEADQNADGRVSLDELYDYVYERVRRISPTQTPTTSSLEKRGEIVIAQNPHARPGVRKPTRARAMKTSAKPQPQKRTSQSPRKTAGRPETRAPARRAKPATAKTASRPRAQPAIRQARPSATAPESVAQKALNALGQDRKLKKHVEVLRQCLRADEELLVASGIWLSVPMTVRLGVLAVTSRRLLWVYTPVARRKIRQLPYEQIITARSELDLLHSARAFGRRRSKLVIIGSPEGAEFLNFTRTGAEELASLINKMVRGER
jgi:uncharacterized caspase-like protein